ncbi:hypothetical protein LZ318_11960 [Saccharopolyspora indica]|uniref:hypothetical protein n=1 Tax=Saccharopolyspora indica TaxID=1229659 RepID=UPI0022EB8319|nr:hypothetical protein [Saccharopolyspora indica]MDA3643777.1 hypothetical protein [Saccharopolyspora indica]
MIPEWLFGPAGDLRPLPPMDMDVVNAIDRFGGVHTSISGGRTVDVLGYKSRYEFEIRHIDLTEYARLESLYTQQIPGPYFLLDPLRRNLVSREASSSRPAGMDFRGISVDGGSLSWLRVTDSPLDWTQRAAQWAGFTAEKVLFIDFGRRFPLLPGTPVTASAYVKPADEVVLRWNVQLYRAGQGIRSVPGPDTTCPAGVWTRIAAALPDTQDYDEASLALQYVSGGTSPIQIIGSQAEFSSDPTDATMGGGSIRVAFDKMETTSPFFPYQSVSLSLLEV